MSRGSIRRAIALLILIAASAVTPLGTLALQAQPAEAPPAFQPIPATVVSTPGVNIRSCARVVCSVKAVAKLGERLLVTGEPVGAFVPVDWGGLTGFVYDLYVATPDGVPELRSGPVGCKRVALIFNIGIGYDTRTDILDNLKAAGVPATIFPMGWWATAHPDILKRIAAAGWLIGSHGDQRVALTTLPDAAVIKDIQQSLDAIHAAIGAWPEPLFTPYAAEMDNRVRALVADIGFLPVRWSVPADDWDFNVAADTVYKNVMNHIQDGSIVELHLDGPSTGTSTAVALPRIVADLRGQGYQFVTIPDLAQPCS